MFGFTHDSPALACDGVSLSAIAEAEGTPVYVYSAAVIRERYSAIDQAFGAYPHRLHYALKANSSLALARLLAGLGSAADANSLWEIELARKAGFSATDIVFTGVGKSPAEIEEIDTRINQMLDTAVDEALASPFPDPSTLMENVYGD